MAVRKVRVVLGTVGLLFSLIFLALAIFCPARINSIPREILENFSSRNQLFQRRNLEFEKKSRDKVGFLRGQELFSELIRPKKESMVLAELNSAALAFYEQVLRWESGRKPNLFFPIDDARGKPTELLLLLFCAFLETEDLSLTFKNHIEKQILDAPKQGWGEFEKSLLALLYLSKRFSLDEVGLLLRPVSDAQQWTALTAFFQLMPEDSKKLLLLFSYVEKENLSDFLDYLALWHKKGISALSGALEIGPAAFNYLIKKQVLIGKDWPAFIAERENFSLFFAKLYLGYSKFVLVLKYTGLFFSVFIALCSLNILLRPVIRKPFLILYIAFALVTTLVILLGVEEGGLMAKPSLPSLRYSQTVSDDMFYSKSFEEGDSDMNTQTLPLAFTLFFLLVQVFIFFLGKIQIQKIQKEDEVPSVKLKLLKNEEHLFDMGLYVGLSGTILSLIFLALGWTNIGLVSAYTSTLFGILEVALLKLLYVRPYRRSLILKIGE